MQMVSGMTDRGRSSARYCEGTEDMQKELLEHIKTEEPATKDIQQIRILQVEDDAVDCEIVERVLTKSQQPVAFSIESVESFEAAVERLSKNEYDLILLDLGLPDSKGTEIIQEVRRINATVPLVVLTGLDDEQTGLSAIQKGADDYLVKGSALNDSLVRAVLYAIERNKAERALQESELKFRTIFENAGGAIFIAENCTPLRTRTSIPKHFMTTPQAVF